MAVYKNWACSKGCSLVIGCPYGHDAALLPPLLSDFACNIAGKKDRSV